MLVNNVGRTEGVFGWFGDQDSDWADEFEEASGKCWKGKEREREIES
jgi:hypothetical protein